MIEVGAKIAGKYRVERILGRGGMGYVLQAFHEHLGESVAIKFMVPELACAPDASARFLREARAAFRIRSEHVARVLDVGEHEGAPFIVMELLSGRDLASEIAERYVPSSEAIAYMLQICEALAAAHALGIVHRDLKPSNLFLTRKGDGSPLIKVLDFGISKAMDDPNVAPADSLTMSHRLLGSPHYMSPEQARAPKSADARSDIWSLGIVLYELVLGERPFRGETPVAILASLLSDKLPEISAEQRRRMPDELMAVVRRCLNRDPDQRFANVGELARALLPMATPSSEQVVVRIENMDRTIPIVDTPPAESPPPLSPPPLSPPPLSPRTHGATLVSARSALVGATSGTHSLDPHEAPVVRRAFGAKALALLAAIAAVLCYWFVVSRIRVPNELDAAPSAQSQPLPKRDKAVQANDTQEPRVHAPRASMEVSPVGSTFEVTPTATSVPAPSAAPSAAVHLDRKSNARTQAPPSAAPATTSAPAASAKGRAPPFGPPRPSSTADPKNQPE